MLVAAQSHWAPGRSIVFLVANTTGASLPRRYSANKVIEVVLARLAAAHDFYYQVIMRGQEGTYRAFLGNYKRDSKGIYELM